MRIHRAIERGDEEAVAAELASGVDVNIREDDSSGMTPLMYAACCDAAGLSMFDLLLKHGAQLNAVSHWGQSTALSCSAYREDKFKYLLAAGADKFAGNLSTKGFPSTDCLELGQLLLDLGYDPTISTDFSNFDTKLDLGNLSELSKELELDLSDLSQRRCPSVLKSSAKYMQLDWLRLFEKNKVSFDQIEWTALMREIVLGTKESVQWQLASGASLTDEDCWERTPLMLAVCTGDLEKAQLIYEAGGRLDHRGSVGRSILDCAIQSKSREMLSWLIALGVGAETPGACDWLPLRVAAEKGNAEAVELLIAAGADVLAVDDCNIQAINEAKNVEVVKLLVAAGADINRVDGTGMFLLRAAVQNRDFAFFSELIKCGADVNQDSLGRTALHEATNYNSLEMIDLLLKNGADPNAAEEDSWRPLWSVRSEEAARLLIDGGADIFARDDFGDNALAFHQNSEFSQFFEREEKRTR